mgnify:CR=1 FL=1
MISSGNFTPMPAKSVFLYDKLTQATQDLACLHHLQEQIRTTADVPAGYVNSLFLKNIINLPISQFDLSLKPYVQ